MSRPVRPARPTATSHPKGRKGSARCGKLSRRAMGASERRDAIIAMALEEFTAKGFAATRLDDVAKRAGVAKGTIYLHFKDKEALFQELVRAALTPLISRVAQPPVAAESARVQLERFADLFAREVIGTKRGDIVRLIISEGARFPALAEFYYREVVAHGLAAVRRLIEYGVARGEIHHDALTKFPQLVVAPALVGVIWHGLFAKYSPLDMRAMLQTHIDILFSARRST